MKKRAMLALVGVSVLAGAVFGQNFSGTYTMTAGTTTLTLVLKQAGGGQVTGTLSSSTGAVFQVSGRVEDDTVTGTCQGQAGTSQFEALFEGSRLIFTLIETGPGGEVTSRSLEFNRAGGASGAADALGLPPSSGGAAPKPPAPRPSQPAPPTAPAPSSGGAVAVPEMGISFVPPAGWNGQRQDETFFLSSTSHPGFIVITRHAYANLQQMAQDAGQGIIDESSNTRLMPVSQFRPFGSNGMVAEFGGTVQGRRARAFAVGLIGPQGGGVTIMAAAEEAGYSSDYSDAVLTIAGGLSFLSGGPSGGSMTSAPPGGSGQTGGATDTGLMNYLAGEYYSYSSGSTMYGGAGTERKMTLCPDGLYRDSSEFSASGTGEWGAVNSQAGGGRWSVQGDKSQGVITVVYPNGQSRRFNYRVLSKDGQTVSFDGVKYAYAGKPTCR